MQPPPFHAISMITQGGEKSSRNCRRRQKDGAPQSGAPVVGGYASLEEKDWEYSTLPAPSRKVTTTTTSSLETMDFSSAAVLR